MKQALIDKFWGLVLKTDGCWLWLGEKSKEGYGRLPIYNPTTKRQKRVRAHRLSWLIHHVSIPQGLFVCHECDNPSCVRPDHLFLGTHEQNMQDMVRKGRGKHMVLWGGENPAAKLTEGQVKEIRLRHLRGESNGSLARAFGVQKGTVSRIVRRLSWIHTQ